MSFSWIALTNPDQLELIKERSHSKPQVIFKHSSRCGTSSLAKNRLEKKSPPAASVDFYFLDFINFRELSDKVSFDFKVSHESPQVLLIKNGQCVYEESHLGISMEEILEKL